jgi:hypothetical protein
MQTLSELEAALGRLLDIRDTMPGLNEKRINHKIAELQNQIDTRKARNG